MILNFGLVAAMFAAVVVMFWGVFLMIASTLSSLFYSFRRTPLASSKPLGYSSAQPIDYFRAPKRGKDTDSNV